MANKIATTQTPKVYAAVRRCIYCGSREGGLTREHIIPMGLGGGLILLKSSCEACRKITADFETTCLRRMYLPYRRHVGLVRHPKDLLPHVPLALDFDGRGAKTVPLDAHPKILLVPIFQNPPGILAGVPPSTQLAVIYQVFGTEEERAGMMPQLAAGGPIGVRFNLLAYTRMLAKIAHSFAVAELGIDAFDPELPPLILGGAPDLASYLIGSTDLRPDPPVGFPAHQIGWAPLRWGAHWVAGVRIRLFAAHDAPACVVIAGVITSRELLTRLGLAQ